MRNRLVSSCCAVVATALHTIKWSLTSIENQSCDLEQKRMGAWFCLVVHSCARSALPSLKRINGFFDSFILKNNAEMRWYLTGFLAISARPKSLPGINFIKVLTEHEDAFDVLYCIAFEMMDAQWLAMRASYMQFKVSQSPYPFCWMDRCWMQMDLLELRTGRDGGNKAAAGEGAVPGGSPWHPGPSCLQPLDVLMGWEEEERGTCCRRQGRSQLLCFDWSHAMSWLVYAEILVQI